MVWQSAGGSGVIPIPDLSLLQLRYSSNQIAEQEGSQINVPMTLVCI